MIGTVPPPSRSGRGRLSVPDTPSSPAQDERPRDRMLSAINFFMVLFLMFPSISHTLPNDEGRSNGGDGKELVRSQPDVCPDDVDDRSDDSGP